MRRLARPPTITASGSASFSSRTIRSFRSCMREMSAESVFNAASAAAPNPARSGTASVPDRSPRSCPPPNKSAGRRRPSLIYSAPQPFGPCTLWELIETRSAPSSFGEKRRLEKGLHRVRVQERGTSRLSDCPRNLFYGQNNACLVVYKHHRDKDGVRPQRVFYIRDVDRAVFSGGKKGDFNPARPAVPLPRSARRRVRLTL